MRTMDGQDGAPTLLGRFDVPVDAFGSFGLPEEWRFLVVDGCKMYLAPDPHEKCLLLVTEAALDKEVALLKRSHDTDAPMLLDRITK